MLPPKIGEGVFGSNCGGVKPTGASASFVAAAAASSAMALMGRGAETVDLSCLGEKEARDCFHGEEDFGAERAGVKREA